MSLDVNKLCQTIKTSPLEPQIAERMTAWMERWSVPADLLLTIDHLVSQGQWQKLTDSFYQDLSFGTGGLRGVVGPGTNRMNAVLVKRVAQGIAGFIQENYSADERRVVIAYDSRLYSKTFALCCAEVLAASGILVFLFDSVETTPCLSFAVRHLKCCTGLCLTASHNPPEYAGLKVYAPDGAQVVPPLDQKILDAVGSVHSQDQVQSMPIDKARQEKRVVPVPDSVHESYYQAVDALRTFTAQSRTVRVVFTPLHGTGAVSARTIMERWGFKDFFCVPEQEHPDGHFPTVKKPNPEEPAALSMLVDFATKKNADVGFATDPDSDRLAMISKEDPQVRQIFSDQSLKDFVLLNGNQTGALLLACLLPAWKKQDRLPPGASVIKTIVTSELHDAICKKYNVQVFDTLTGFKWIADLVRQWEENNAPQRYLFGTEESFGYMPGSYVRDKDGIAALALAAEVTDWLKQQSLSPCQKLLQLFAEFGSWREDLHTIDLEGKLGQERIQVIMTSFRTSPPLQIGSINVDVVEDYQTNTKRVRENGSQTFGRATPLGHLPASDVLIFRLADGGKISARPSGTEPKIKFYFSAVVHRNNDPIQGYQEACKATQYYRDQILDLVSKLA
jgi:phosphoglucomutase